MVDGVGCSNGLAWSPDSRTMYFTDSHTGLVWAYDFDPATGDIANRRVFIDLTAEGGIVDGATVDAEGCYWLTVPFKGKVLAYDPTGKLMRTIELPTDLPTCCEFGGEDLDILYVTSATLRRVARGAEGPAAGRRPLRHRRLGVEGPAAGAVQGVMAEALSLLRIAPSLAVLGSRRGFAAHQRQRAANHAPRPSSLFTGSPHRGTSGTTVLETHHRMLGNTHKAHTKCRRWQTCYIGGRLARWWPVCGF